jgi:hypothetical protein
MGQHSAGVAGLVACVTGCSLVTPFDDLSARYGSHDGGTLEGGAGGDASGGPCTADVSKDPDNCGRCGHSCRGAECADGACTPTVLASGLSGPQGIVVNRATVFFSIYRGTTIDSCPLGGCNGAPTTFASTTVGPASLALDAKSIYWASEGAGGDGAVYACAAAGCSSPTLLAGGQNVSDNLTTDGESVFWTASGTGTGLGAVRSCASTGCAAPTTIAQGRNLPWGIAVDAANVYWTEWGAGAILSPPDGGGSLLKCPKAGCPAGGPTTLVSGLSQPWAVAVDAQNAYVTNFKTGTVVRCSLSGCGNAATVIASGEGGPSGVALDATRVYWTNYNSSTVRACALSGCGAGSDVIATAQVHASGIALDDDYVYVANGGTYVGGGVGKTDGTVIRAVK